MQIRLVGVEHAGSAGAGLGKELFDDVDAVEAAHDLLGQFEFPHDRFDALALSFQRLHRVEARFGARHQGRVLLALDVRGLGRLDEIGGTTLVGGDLGRKPQLGLTRGPKNAMI